MTAKSKRTTTQISVRNSYDSLSITIKYPSGASFKYKVNRNGETVELAFSNDPIVLKQQLAETNLWIKSLTGTYGERIEHIKTVLGPAKSGAEAMELMRAAMKK